MKRSVQLVTVTVTLIVLAALTGCAGMQYKNPSEMTPTEKMYLVLKLYNNAYAGYEAQIAATPQPMSVEMGNYFTAYKKVLTISHPTIQAYKTLVMANGVPTLAQEQEIIKLIYLLQSMLIKEVTK